MIKILITLLVIFISSCSLNDQSDIINTCGSTQSNGAGTLAERDSLLGITDSTQGDSLISSTDSTYDSCND